MTGVVPAAVVFSGMCRCTELIVDNTAIPVHLGAPVAVGMAEHGQPVEAIVAELTRLAVVIRHARESG